MRSRYAIALWLLLTTCAALIVARARYTADLSAFLPNAPTAGQRLLVDQLREGPASRLILVALEGSDPATLGQLSRALAARLRRAPELRSVANGEPIGFEHDRDFVFAHRYALSEQVVPSRFTAEGLRAAIGDGIEQLASPLGLLARDLFVRDPTGETLQVLAQLDRTSRPRSIDGVWMSANGQRALLVAETRATGADTDGQARAIAAIRSSFGDARHAAPASAGTSLRLTGPGVFGVTARATIESEAVRLSLLSSALIAVLLLLVYRSVPVLLLGLLPVATGALAGVAAVALGFSVVHGVTLGFGVTLIGESVDYSVYLFVQSQRAHAGAPASAKWVATLWPTIRLGMLTSVCGFASLLPSGFPGLAQLGLYSIAGLVSAALVTRFVLPALLPARLELRDAAPLGRAVARTLAPLRRVRPLLWLLPLGAALVLGLQRDRLWNRELSALSPVAQADQALDAALRADLGAPDVRTLAIVSAADPDGALRAAEVVATALDALVGGGQIAGFETPSRYLPSIATQRQRLASLPEDGELQRRLKEAVAALPVRAELLEPFVRDVAEARHATVIGRADLAGTSLAGGLNALLVHADGRWHALLPLQAVHSGPRAFTIDVEAVTRAVAAAPVAGAKTVVLDLKRESDRLYASYLAEAVRLSLLGFVAILVLLYAALRSIARVARVVAPLVIAVMLVMAGFAAAGRPLTILHLIGLLLVIAIGSNYALFFDRQAADADPAAAARTLASLCIANLTTVLAFGVLALSKVPVLAALGSTVAPGTLLALVLAALLARAPPAGDGSA